MQKATIENIKATGVIVRLGDGIEAWLPARELSIDYDPTKKLTEQNICSVGETLEVIAYGIELGGKKRPLVSRLRAHNDPWEKIKTWKDQDIKELEVLSVTPHRAFGRIEPGIEGYMDITAFYNHIKFRRTWDNFKTIAAGDTIAGYVDTGGIDNENRLVKLDVASYVKNLSEISSALSSDTTMTGDAHTEEPTSPTQKKTSIPRFVGVEHMLIVEDSEMFLEDICSYLESSGIEVSAARSKEEAEKLLSAPECPDLDLAILAVHLTTGSDYTGLQLVKVLKEKQPRCSIVLNTGGDLEVKQMLDIAGDVEISALLYKPFGIRELNQVIADSSRTPSKCLKAYFNKIEELSLVPLNTKIRPLRAALQDLSEEISAETVILFRIHPVSFKVEIAAEYGDVSMELHSSLSQMRKSPVTDVAIGGETIVENSIYGTAVYPKHRHLHQVLKYESCIAMPVAVTNQWRSALFAFHRSPHQFQEKNLKHRTKVAAKEIANINEIMRLQKTIKRENPFYLAGKTYGSMAHDLLDALSREFKLKRIFDTLEGKSKIGLGEITYIKSQLAQLQTALTRAKGIVETFRRMSRSHLEKPTDINVYKTISEVAENIKHEADALQAKVSVAPVEDEGRWQIKMRETSFEQVIFNLILNAAQQINRFTFARAQGYIRLELGDIEKNERHWVRILIHDTGPGIHGCCFENIFEEGYSTIEDRYGMGLEISRNIIKEVGGKIRVLKSILFVGTTFELLLPIEGKES